ncbi:hypothetical protein TNCV_4092861 [Trichonephila clavipes]|nr:hypothetical protein TNCV_4092861 [Trichonephila clavipes]
MAIQTMMQQCCVVEHSKDVTVLTWHFIGTAFVYSDYQQKVRIVREHDLCHLGVHIALTRTHFKWSCLACGLNDIIFNECHDSKPLVDIGNELYYTILF